LVEGNNTVTVTVTAADGTVRTVSIPVYVTPLSSNTNLSVLKVNNVTVADAGSISVANKTLNVAVVATPEDAESVVAISGDSALRTGNNTVSILVTAPNGSKRTYTVTVVVLKSSNTDLKSLTVNGSAITAGATATLAPRSASAVIKAVTADPEATVAITGATGLVSGNNSASVTVTAADGTTRQVAFTLYVTPLSSDNTLKSFQVNGSTYVADSTVELALGTTSVAVSALANDATASVEITGNTGLTGGLNTITVKVTAANGDVRNYTAKVNVPVRSSNANISTVAGTWTINGVDVSAIASDAVAVELPAGATAVSAAAKTDDAKATIAITGATGLVTGPNTITFKVTAEDGTTTKTYTRTVNVKALSANTNLTSLTVAGQSVTNGATVNVVAGTTRVEVTPVLESAEARVTITGNTGLSTGSNSLVVTVTAPSGATATTTITVVVAAPASNTNLATFVINGTALTDGSVISVAAGTTRLRVSAIAADSTASVSVAGRSGLKTGTNTLVVTVTAISGAQATYTVTVNVAG
jgi:ribosomal protein S28E/S33